LAKRGITLLDLASPYPGSQAILPGDLASRLENFAVVSHRSTTSAGAVIHSGIIQPLSDLGFPSLRNWDVEVPGLNAGLPFRLVRIRAVPEAGQTLEPAGSSAFLDLVVDRIAITVPGLRPATLVPSAPASVGHLLPDTSRSKVKIVGAGVVRLDLSGNGDLVRFVDWPDPFDPAAPSGAVVRLTFDPVSFFIGGSEVGMTVDRLVFDASAQVTPPEIIARGQTPGWQGIAIAEATLYLPPNTPVVDKVKVAVRDVLLGSPAGLQGEIQVELGRTPVNAAAVQFLQDFADAEQPRPTQGSGRELTVPFLTGTPSTARMRARFDPAILSTSTQPRMQWRLPEGTVIDGNDTGWFGTAVGEVMSGRFSEQVGGTEVFDTPTTYAFVQSESEVQHAAKVNVHVGSVDIANVVSVSGSGAALNLLEFESALNPADAAGLKWKHGEGGDAHTRTGPDFVLMPASEPGTSYIVVTDANNRTRRIRVDVLAEGSLLVGAEDGVHDEFGALIDVRGVEQTYNLNAFHRDGSLKPLTPNAPVSGGVVSVPDGGLAEVTVGIGRRDDPEAPAAAVTEDEVRHLRIRFEYALRNPVTFDLFAPRTQQGTLEATVRAWAAFFPGAKFVVIGRCCDLPLTPSSAPYNADLARDRAEAVVRWLPAGSTHARGEQTLPSAAMSLAQDAVPDLEPEEKAANRLITVDFTNDERAAWGSVATQPDRQKYRRVDIYAVGGTYTPPAGANPSDQQQPTDTQELDPALRRSYVPGEDVDEVQLPDPSGPRLPWLVRLVVRWDSPTVTEWADAIPTQAEFTFEWAASPPRTIPAPGGGTAPVPVRSPSQPAGTTSTEVYTLTGRWSYDSRSGQTVFSLSIASSGDPEGLGAIDSEFLAVALALAPALLAGIGAAGVDGAAVRIAALAVASGVLATVAKDGEVVLHSAEIEHRQRSLTDLTGFRTRVLLDYTAAIGLEINANALGRFGTGDGHPLKVRYKKVGLEFDDSQTEWYDKFGLVFDDVSFEVCEPGRWQIDGPLGQVLQVVATRAGVGSSWFECDLEFALDLGVVSINGATVRCTFTDSGFSAELRGLALGVNIPGVLRGEGRVVLGDGGAFKGALEVELESVGAKGMGALAFDPSTDFLSIALGLVLPVGIPLANTGLGVFGFIGMFVSNGARALPTGFAGDPVGREIAWYRETPYEDKFAPQRGQWALGLGMIVGTLPDQAFTFNAMGMFVVAFPDPTVIFGIDAKLVKKPAVRPATQGPPADPSLSILGLIAIDDEAVMVGVRGRYAIPKVLELRMPIDGYFPYATTPPTPPGHAYVRIGSDGVLSVDPPRPGDPVTITLLPDTLDVTAFSYLMIEERQLHRLGDNPDFNFDGFSVGFGAGWEIRWSAGPIKLEASAKVLVGFGTNPFLLKGGIFVRGELSLVVVKVSARGSIVVTVWEDGGVKVNLDGEFCGSVSFFFFSIEGCVGIEIGDPITPTAPPPPPPTGKVSLTDRRGFTTALATTGTPGPEETVWPDTVPVIEFAHHLAVDLTGSAFNPGGGPAGPAWAGTSELKYAYRLTGVEIVPDSGAALAGPLDSGWWLPTNRPGVLADGDVAVSESEGMFLALLAWDPAPWTYWLTDGGAGTAGDPSTTPGRLCDPPTRPRPGCVLGERGTRSGIDAADFRPDSLGTPPFPSRFTMYARERALGMPLASVTPFLSASGWGLIPGQVGPGPFGDDVWWLASLTDHSFTARTTELRGVFAPEIGDGELLLVVCRDFRKRPPSTQPGACEVVADHFGPDVDIGTGDAIGSVKIASHSTSMRTFEGVNGARTSLHYPDDGMTFFLPGATDQVVVTVQPLGSSVEARALDAPGEVVAESGTGPDENPVDLVLVGPGIVQVELFGGAFEVGVLQVCWGSTIPFPGDAEDAVVGDLPVVLGTVVGGGEQEWTPEVERQTRTRTGSCSLVRYMAPDRATTWSGLRIREWAGTGRQDAGQIGLVQVCGVSAQADAVATANADYAAFLLGLINGLATTAEPARKDLLEPNRGYTINVAWEWQGWIKTDAQPLPPATPPVSGWQAGTPQSYRFRTAAAVTTGGMPPAELTDERDFDPRSMLRYLIAFDPDKGSAPHLLDDTLLVHLAVDHLDQLAGLYGRHVQLRLRRTDPPPGSLATQPHPDDEPITVAWGKLHDRYRPEGQKRFLDAIRAAPCLEEPNLGGTTGEVTADLVPGAWYDLMLMATPTASPNAEDVVVSRSHFQASRYRNETELLEALGFGVPGPEAFIAPDAIVAAAVLTGSLAVGDADLDAALVAAGLDPWPLSDRARTSILWLNDAGTWRLAGLLLEAPEAIVRTGRTALDVTACTYGGVSLSQRARNLAGTRVLLTPPSPVVVAGADRLTVTLTRTVTDRTGTTTSTTISGARFAIGQPRSVLMEAGV
jgi:hypothetical protein